MNIVAVEAKGDKAAILLMSDGARVWTPDRAKADGLVGKPIPTDWTQKQGEYGPQAFPPREGKPGGGKPAWANTEEGEKYVQERMDRRTALMQAVTTIGSGRGMLGWDDLAGKFYAWLRAPLESVSAPRVVAGGKSETVAAPAWAASGEAVEPGQVGADTPSDGGGGIEYPQVGSGKPPSASATPPPSSPTHAEKWSPYGNPEKCAHQLVPGIKGWLKCTKCGTAKKESEWA